MGKRRAKARAKKAELEARAAGEATRKAAQDSAVALRELGLALIEQGKQLRLDQRAGEVAGRVRDSESLDRARVRADRMTSVTRQRLRDAGLDERATQVAARVRSSDAYRNASEGAGRATERSLSQLGGWLSTGRVGERLGVQPRKRRFPWLTALAAIVAGFAAGVLSAPKRGQELRAQITRRGGAVGGELGAVAGRIGNDTADIGAPPAQKTIADEVRTRLGEDPRTSDLPKLNINVVEGTVFIRGAVPESFDQEQIRAVVATVPGVTDVDLQLSASRT